MTRGPGRAHAVSDSLHPVRAEAINPVLEPPAPGSPAGPPALRRAVTRESTRQPLGDGRRPWSPGPVMDPAVVEPKPVPPHAGKRLRS